MKPKAVTLKEHNKKTNIEKWLKSAPRGVAVIVFSTNSMRVMLPQLSPGTTVHEDHPVFRATLSATIHGEDHEDIRQSLAERLGAVRMDTPATH